MAVGKPLLLHDTHTVQLRRAAAANASKPLDWHLIVQKKILLPFRDTAARLSKMVFCSRQKGLHAFDCCVKKVIETQPTGDETADAMLRIMRKRKEAVQQMMLNL